MILNKKLELKLEVAGIELKAGMIGSYFHLKNVSEQELEWEDDLGLQDFYVFPSGDIEDDKYYDFYECFLDTQELPIYKCKQIDCLYEDIDDFCRDLKDLLKGYCKENKIPYIFMDHYFEGCSEALSCVDDILYDTMTEGVCNEYDKYKKFKWQFNEETGIIKIYDNIIVSDMEEQIKTKGQLIKFFNNFADIWNNAVVGKYEHED